MEHLWIKISREMKTTTFSALSIKNDKRYRRILRSFIIMNLRVIVLSFSQAASPVVCPDCTPLPFFELAHASFLFTADSRSTCFHFVGRWFSGTRHVKLESPFLAQRHVNTQGKIMPAHRPSVQHPFAVLSAHLHEQSAYRLRYPTGSVRLRRVRSLRRRAP